MGCGATKTAISACCSTCRCCIFSCSSRACREPSPRRAGERLRGAAEEGRPLDRLPKPSRNDTNESATCPPVARSLNMQSPPPPAPGHGPPAARVRCARATATSGARAARGALLRGPPTRATPAEVRQTPRGPAALTARCPGAAVAVGSWVSRRRVILELPPSPQLFLMPADLQQQQADATLDGCSLGQGGHGFAESVLLPSSGFCRGAVAAVRARVVEGLVVAPE